MVKVSNYACFGPHTAPVLSLALDISSEKSKQKSAIDHRTFLSVST